MLIRFLLAIVLIFSLLNSTAYSDDKKSVKVTDEEILKRLGVDQHKVSQTEQDNKLKRDKKEKLTEIDSGKQEPTYKIHTVKPGEHLGMIAKTYYGDYKKIALIAEFNSIKNFDQIKVGQKIKIPVFNKEVEKVKGVIEEDLAAPKEIETSPIGETDLKREGLIPPFNLKMVIVILVFLLMIMSILLIKLFCMKDIPDVKEFKEEGAFTLGEAEDSEKINI